MGPEEPTPESQETPPTGGNQTPLSKRMLVILGIVGLVALVSALIVANVGGEGPAAEAPTATQPPTAEAPDSSEAVSEAGPQVPPITGCSLLTDDDVEEAMGLLSLPWAERGLILFEGGEGCVWQHVADGEIVEGLSVKVAPGTPDDFQPGALLNGVESVPASEIGEEAVWFGREGEGVLSVVQGTPLGYLFVRVTLNRSDLDDSTRLEIVKGLAATAIERIQFGPAPPVEADLCQLVTDDDAEQLLAPHREGRPFARDEVVTIDNFSAPVDISQPGDFSCNKLITAEIYVAVESGSAADFEAGIDIGGVVGEPVSVVGEEAVWFEGVPVTGAFETGILAVRTGEAYFRIVLSLPDVELGDQLGIAKRLAINALATLSGDEGELIVIERAEPDLSKMGFVDNLLTKEQSEEWTLGEGLVATLRFFVDEVDASQVLRDPELVNYSGTGIIRLATEYLETGPDASAKAEITRLLDLLVFTDGQEDSTAGSGPLTVALNTGFFTLGLTAQQDSEGDQDYVTPDEDDGGYRIPDDGTYEQPACASDEPALPGWTPSAYEVADTGAWKFAVFFPVAGLENGWKRETHLLWALEALTDSLAQYGDDFMPCIQILFSRFGGSYTYVLDTSPSRVCGISVNRPMQTRNEGHFKQQIAADIAHCAIAATYPDQTEVASYLKRRWWNHALAEYMSNIVYPAPLCNGQRCDLEWRLSDSLAAQETTSMVLRSDPNWLFFQQVFWELGNKGVDAIIRALPTSVDPIAHETALAALPGMAEFYHNFSKGLTDGSIRDSGGGEVPYTPRADTVSIGGPWILFDEPEPFGVTRLYLTITQGEFACMESQSSGDILVSYRSGSPGKGGGGGGWQQLPEQEDVYSGDMVVLVTTTRPQTDFTLRVKKVVEDPEDCEEEEPEEEGPEEGPEEGSRRPLSPPTSCDLSVCGSSDFFLGRGQVGPWLEQVLPPLSDPVQMGDQ